MTLSGHYTWLQPRFSSEVITRRSIHRNLGSMSHQPCLFGEGLEPGRLDACNTYLFRCCAVVDLVTETAITVVFHAILDGCNGENKCEGKESYISHSSRWILPQDPSDPQALHYSHVCCIPRVYKCILCMCKHQLVSRPADSETCP